MPIIAEKDGRSAPRALVAKRGSAISEFLIVAPIIIGLLYAGMELNDRLTLKQSMHITARNVAALPDDKPAADELAKSLPMLAKKSQGQSVFVAESKHEPLDGADRPRVKTAWPQDENSFKTISEGAGHLGEKGALAIDTVKNDLRLGDVRLFLEDKPERFTIKVGTQTPTLMERGMDLAFDLVSEDGNPGQGLSFNGISSSYVRTSTGYHPDDYYYYTALGYAVGKFQDKRKHWGEPYERPEIAIDVGAWFFHEFKGYQYDCMMHFAGNDRCVPTNILSTLLVGLYSIKGVIQGIADLLSGGSTNALAQASRELVDGLADVAIDEAKAYAEEKVLEKAKDMSPDDLLKSQFGRSFQDIANDWPK